MPNKTSTKLSSRKKKTVVVSGGFDPIHVGHLRMIQEAGKLGDRLVVILNNDNWLKKKKTHIFMHQKERKELLKSIRGVDEVVITSHPKNPKDMSVVREILKIKPDIFANGGDRKSEKDIPEVAACNNVGATMIFNVGQGDKVQSSSWLLARYVNKVKPARRLNVEKIIGELRVELKKSKIKFPEKLRTKTAKIILRPMSASGQPRASAIGRGIPSTSGVSMIR